MKYYFIYFLRIPSQLNICMLLLSKVRIILLLQQFVSIHSIGKGNVLYEHAEKWENKKLVPLFVYYRIWERLYKNNCMKSFNTWLCMGKNCPAVKWLKEPNTIRYQRFTRLYTKLIVQFEGLTILNQYMFSV